MGAIASVAAWDGHSCPAVVRAMLAAAPHRGASQATLAHGACSLGVVNSHERRQDAWLGGGGSFAAAFTGSLDNLADLARGLSDRGTPVRPPIDPARLLIALFEQYGEDAPRRLRGAFAAIVTDGRRLMCFRDHVGLRSLFYREDARGVFVATEAKQVVAGSGLVRNPNLDVLEAVYFGAADDETPSALEGVRRLPKATMLRADPRRVQLLRYWHPESLLETARLSSEEIASTFDQLMTTAVSRTVTGHDAVSLSGGIDSPAVAAFAAPAHLELTGRPISALSSVYPNFPDVDERRYIELVAGDLQIPLHVYEHTARPLDRLREWAELADGPVPTMSLSHYEEHYRRARQLGFETVLTGELAEFVMDLRNFLIPHLLWGGRFSALGKQLAARRSKGASYAAVGRHVASALVPTAVTRARLRHQDRGVPSWLDARRVNEAGARSLVRARDRWRAVQLAGFIGPGITVEAEQICQDVCGVTARRPWVDVDLWEFFLSLPAELKFPDGVSKGLVRKLLRGRVPDAILDRRDKTLFDQSIMADIDYATLRQWLLDPTWHLPGVDYGLLQRRLGSEDISLPEFLWAKDLAGVHAFLSSWGS